MNARLNVDVPSEHVVQSYGRNVLRRKGSSDSGSSLALYGKQVGREGKIGIQMDMNTAQGHSISNASQRT